jgi:hypothetical protein
VNGAGHQTQERQSHNRVIPRSFWPAMMHVVSRNVIWASVSSSSVISSWDFRWGLLVAEFDGAVVVEAVGVGQGSLEDFGATLTGYGTGDAFVQGMVDMMRARDEGLDDGVQRTPQTASPTTFRRWCDQVLKPAVLA